MVKLNAVNHNCNGRLNQPHSCAPFCHHNNSDCGY
uniref:Uncharacterized protein n=1 Tax=Rhizophora mucronata TaxID=61149 RepID=A0A2P2QQ22_RHIMU